MDGSYGVVLVTVPSVEDGEAIARSLIAAKLAACVNLFPIQSIYTWKGEVHQDQEWQLTIKTDLSRFDELEQTIRSLHPYEVPEIIALPIVAGSAAYLTWITEHTR